VLHLALAEAHGLTDRQSDRPPLVQSLDRRLDLDLDPSQLEVTELHHRRQLTELTPRTLPSDVTQDVDRISSRGGHTPNLEPTTDTYP
jgi:hypothetical protein